MEGLKEIAKAYYDRSANEEEIKSAIDFLKRIDSNGDRKISFFEFKTILQQWPISHENLFRQLDRNGDGVLNFEEVLGFYYMMTKVNMLLVCSSCRDFLLGPFFSCLFCLGKGDDTFELCCSCYNGGKVVHEHSNNNLVDNCSLIKFLRDRMTADAQKSCQAKKSEIEELRDIAIAQFRASSPEVQALAHQFFQSLDTNGDRMVDLKEFLGFTSREGYARMNNPSFFKDLDRNGNGSLDFWEVLTLHYIINSGRPFCDCCGNFIPGVFFSCVECFKNTERTFDLCRDCYCSSKWSHNHNGRSQFLDNYTLLGAPRNFSTSDKQRL